MKQLIHFLLVEKSNNIWIQLFRYFFVGGSAFIVDFGLLYVLYKYCGLHYLLATAVAFIAGLTVNYFISIKWVFNKGKVSDRRLEFIIFGVIGIVGLGFNELIMWIMTDIVGYQVMISKIISAAIVFGWNFAARRFILFNK